ncbi:MAG TPA: lipopolysaccharide biosynthesis protein [Gemmatimonadales bacterium]|jgi:lipopolysaccharide exporter|nr:lipopolysaccharide biosynthesis protein [Gemmatimonadales bacterium]
MVKSPMASIGRALVRGSAWMIGFRLLDRSVGLISMLVLARVLTPADFGLVAMATALIAFVELFGWLGLEIALIQRPGATREHFDSAWTMNVLIGASVALMLLLCAWPLARFYGDDRLVALVVFLALGPLFQGCENIGVVAFRKELNFEREFRFLLSKRLLSFAITVALALWLRSYWALAIGMVFGRLAGVAISYALHPFRPRWSLSRAGDLLHFSLWLVAQNIFVFLKDRGPDFIVGKFAGAHALGMWSVANELSNLVGTELIQPMNRAALPTYSQLAEDRAALAAAYLSAAGLVAVLVMPLVVGLAAVAPLVVAVLLGPQWREVGPLISLLAFHGLVDVFLRTAASAVLAGGRPIVYVKIYALQVCVLLPLSFWLTREYGVQGAVVATVGTALGLLPLNATLVARAIGVSARQLLATVWRPLLAAAVMYGVTVLAQPPIDTAALTTGRALVLLAIFVPLGAATYIGVVLSVWMLCGRPSGAETVLLGQAASYWRRMTGRAEAS